MSVHQAAALVIGRRAMGYDERFVSNDGYILSGPGRNRSKADCKRWRGVHRLTKQCKVASGSEVGIALMGGCKKPTSNSVSSTRRRKTVDVPLQVGDAVVLATVITGQKKVML